MRRLCRFAILCALWMPALASLYGFGQTNLQPASDAASTQERHYVVLVSLSGFRWDYAARDGARNLLALGTHGAWAPQGMVPGYPASAWPSQFTIATGLYPGHHGIVSDHFFDPARNAYYSADDPKTADDGSWYSGTPLWSLAEHAGIRTACIGWAGCTAEIAGYRPALRVRAEKPLVAVRRIVEWLRLPEQERPHLVVAQLAEPGVSAWQSGPDAPKTRAAVRRVDEAMGRLNAELEATHLPVDLVVVSDRGLVKPDGEWITLDHYADLNGFETAGAQLYGKSEADRERAYNQLKKATSEFFVYRLKDLPAKLYFRNSRAGDPVIIATGPYAIRARASAASDAMPAGIDGFDARTVPEMKAIFFAAGPDIVEGRTVAPFESVNLYPWLAHLLGLTPPKTDGSLNILSGTLRDNGAESEN